MIYEILNKIEQSIQIILVYLLNLCFQPIYALVQIIQAIAEVWDSENVIDPDDKITVPEIKQFASPNEGKCGTEFDDEEEDISTPPIGYKLNRNEQDEIKKIKEQLNK